MLCDDTLVLLAFPKKSNISTKERITKLHKRAHSNFEHSVQNEMSIKTRVHTAKNAKICCSHACYRSFQATCCELMKLASLIQNACNKPVKSN